MSLAEILTLVWGFIQGFLTSTAFILALFIGFCIIVGFTKLKRTAGNVPVIKSLDETVTHKPFTYLSPSAPRGPVDQLRTPELLAAAAPK